MTRIDLDELIAARQRQMPIGTAAQTPTQPLEEYNLGQLLLLWLALTALIVVKSIIVTFAWIGRHIGPQPAPATRSR